MAYYSYVVRRDFGFAPNPFGLYCTLATCKQDIRSRAEVNDWIFGTGSKEYQKSNHLIFVMKVTEIVSFQEYWNDARFADKRPIMNGSRIGMYGDNIYHKKEDNGEWFQEDSHHSYADGRPNIHNLTRDLSGNRVLISDDFIYLGKKSVLLTDSHRSNVCKKGPGYKKDAINSELANELINNIKENYGQGLKGLPNQMTPNFKRYDGK